MTPEAAKLVPPVTVRLCLWAPRWHGFARWTLEDVEGNVLQRGWWRPPCGWCYQEVAPRDYRGREMKWFPFMGGVLVQSTGAPTDAS